MKQVTINYYTFEELSEEVKEKVIQKYWDINVNSDWWDWVYENAKNIGIEIESFDIDRGSYCHFKNTFDADDTYSLIISEHGEGFETYELAEQYSIDKGEILSKYSQDDIDAGLCDNELTDLAKDFQNSLEKWYLFLLRKGYEYLTSEWVIKETLISNEYYFNEEGEME